MLRIRKAVNDIIACERGIAFVEFAYCLTLLMLLLWGGVELSRYVLIMQKLEDSASQETNIISTTDPKNLPTQAEMNAILQSVTQMMSPYAFNNANSSSNTNIVILTDIYRPSPPVNNPGQLTVPMVQWRYCWPGVGGNSTRSKLGAVGNAANLSQFPNFSMAVNDEIIVAEIYYQFSPIIHNFITDGLLPVKTPVYAEAMSVPRFGSLTALVGTNFKSNCP